MSWIAVGIGAAVGAAGGAAIGSQKGGDDVWKGALLGGVLGAGAGGAGAGLAGMGGAAGAGGAGTATAATTGTAATSGTAATAGLGATEAGGLMGAGGASIPGIGATSAMPIAGTTTAAMPGAATVGTGLGATTAGTAGTGATGTGYTAGLAGQFGTTIPGVGTAAAEPIFGTGATGAATGMGSGQAGGFNVAAGANFGGGSAFGAPTAGVPTATTSGGGVFGGVAPEATAEVGAYGGGAGGSGGGSGGVETAGKFTDWEKAALVGALVAPALMPSSSSSSSTDDDYSMGLASLSPNFEGYEPDQPSPYYKEKYKDYKTYAAGGPVALAAGGDPMSPMSNTVYPQSQQQQTAFASSPEIPNSLRSAMAADYDTRTDPMTGMEMPMGYAKGGHLSSNPNIPNTGIYRDTDPDTANKDAYSAAKTRLQKVNKAAGMKGLPMPKGNMEKLGTVDLESMASGGIAHYSLGGYSDGGRMLKGPGDGMSDSIPASIGGKQAARLADGEFVVPADVVSHLGNGSTDAGANKLYGMMDKVRKARTGTKKQGKQIKADKYLPK